MNIYLDDDHDADILIGLLQLLGHNVVSPRSIGTSGFSDEAHLNYSADNDCVLLTANAKDFIEQIKRGSPPEDIILAFCLYTEKTIPNEI